MLEKYLRHLTIERGLSKNTLAAYQRDLISLSQYLDSLGLSLESATEAQLRSFVEKLLSEGFARSSTARTIASIRGFYKFLFEEGALSIDPAARMDAPKLPLRLPKALSHEQVLCLLEAAGPEPASEFSDSIGLRNRAILELMYSTGARVSEISNLDLDEIHNEGFVRVKGKGSKERVVPIGSYAQASLDAYLIRGRPDLVKKSTPALWLNKFGGRLSRQSIWEVVQIAGKKCGVEVSPHTLRHCFATHLIEGGADVRVVQELLGHASVTTTQIYTKVTLDSLREVYQLSHPRARR